MYSLYSLPDIARIEIKDETCIGRMRNVNLNGRGRVGNLGVHWRVILKWILTEIGC